MIPRQTQQVSVKEIDGQLLVLDRAHGKLHELNATASFIWQQCNGVSTSDQIAASMAEAFEIDPQTAARDVLAILQQLVSCRLIHDAASDGD